MERGVAQWEVERIVKQRNTRKSGHQYQVRWKGFDSTMDTWEPASSINEGAPDIVRSLM